MGSDRRRERERRRRRRKRREGEGGKEEKQEGRGNRRRRWRGRRLRKGRNGRRKANVNKDTLRLYQYSTWACKFILLLWQGVRQHLLKLNIRILYDPVIPLIGINPTEKCISKDIQEYTHLQHSS